MNATGAVIFLPREGTGVSLMLQELLFDPAARWLAQALSGAGVERFFVVCHSDDQAQAQACFPAGTEFVTGVSQDAVEQLVRFLESLEGKVLVLTKPVLLDWQEAGQLVSDQNAGALDNRDTGIYRLDAAALGTALGEGVGLEEALRENADMLGGRSVWFQGGYPLRPGWAGRAEAEMTARQYGAVRLMRAGVRVMDPNTCYVGPRAQVGKGTLLLPGTILRGECVIGKDCVLGPNTMIRDCVVGRGVRVNASQLSQSTVEDGARVGPFACLRPGCHVGPGVRVGNFVELKNATVGEDSKISHLAYVGDADVGAGVDIGCGTATVNYDGAQKYRTVIGDNAFIGCNTSLVAPVRVGEGAYTAAGSTITDDVPADSLAIARARQMVKKQWAAKRRTRRR